MAPLIVMAVGWVAFRLLGGCMANSKMLRKLVIRHAQAQHSDHC
jgi:hypothetical protein